ncbi:MAG: Lrp/AsnC family transcriptional regulator [Cyclobacteriaceae bacterium]|nr:Lrp/AsnC family transcriptional regulator [Cyclobacteriaceae bacterium HetDA_MAG_MS6]
MSEENTQLDDLDFAILIQLQDDGRKSFTDIAENLKVSVGTVRTRIAKLIEDKTLQVVGRVDTQKVGFEAYAHIAVSVRPVELLDKVAEKIARLSEVSFLAEITGNHDLEVNVMCRNNEHLAKVINQIRRVEGVYKTETSMYFKVVKYAQPDLNLVKYKRKDDKAGQNRAK